MPYAGPGVGFFAIPPKGANIWVEFEGGDPDRAIWTGCFWDSVQIPPLKPEVARSPTAEKTKVFKTEGVTLTFSDLPGAGGFTLEIDRPAVQTPLKLVFDVNGIELSTGNASVTRLGRLLGKMGEWRKIRRTR